MARRVRKPLGLLAAGGIVLELVEMAGIKQEWSGVTRVGLSVPVEEVGTVIQRKLLCMTGSVNKLPGSRNRWKGASVIGLLARIGGGLAVGVVVRLLVEKVLRGDKLFVERVGAVRRIVKVSRSEKR